MPQKLTNQVRLDEGIKEAAQHEVNKAIDALQNYKDKAKAIHYTRKRMKEVRGVLRLIRDHIDKEVYKQDNTFFRDTARQFSELRDNEVFIDVLNNLWHQTEGDNQQGIAQIIRQAQESHDQQKETLLHKEHILDTVKQKLSDAHRHIDNWPVKGNDFDTISSGIKRVYKRGHKAFDLAYHEPSIDNFHEFRKRVKYLRYHIEFIENSWKKVLKAYRKEISQLSDFLGEDHDYGMTIQKLQSTDYGISEEIIGEIINMAEYKRKNLQEEALPLAQKIYAEEPDEFIKRLSTYWNVWKLNANETENQE